MGTITVRNISKAYKQYPTRLSRLVEWFSLSHRPRHIQHWILQDIDFTVKPGEAVGIIGINGAGKSTLLKIITGTTQPTTGSVQLQGRVAALLELGMGFHSDFTGRQNAFMAGQLMGLNSQLITELMPEIESFAEIGDYIDQPMRIYSSGMQMRLAFSVATVARPDILIVDEALSVGDAHFQHKSFDRIREFKKLGTTLLIVSHDKQSIQSVCDKAILLNAGKIEQEGKPEAVMDYYNAIVADKEAVSIKQTVLSGGRIQTISGTGEVDIESVSLLNSTNTPVEIVKVGEKITLQLKVHILKAIPDLVIGYLIKDKLGQPIYGTNTHNLQFQLNKKDENNKFIINFSFEATLGEGSYSIAVAAHAGAVHVGGNYQWKDLALVFSVINSTGTAFIGSSWMPPQMEVIKNER